jgi:hypothetical protein
MGFRIKIRPKTRLQLAALANPESANQPEALPWVLYDTQAWTTAVTATATYFGTVQGDKTLGNMEGPGQLPDPQYFEIAYWGVDFMLASINAAAPGATVSHWADLIQFLWTQRGTFEFNISNKRIGPFPLTFFHSSGGPTGYGYGNSATTARFEYGNNGIFDGGFCVENAIIIPPKLGFDVTLRTFAAPTLVAGSPLNVRVWQAGVLHRRVL